MANSARGEAELAIAGRTYTVAMNMGALARMAEALGVNTFKELQDRLTQFNLPDMPKVVSAVLAANGHDVPAAAIEAMNPFDYFERVIPAIFRRADDPKVEEGEANPPKRQAKK